MRRSSWGCAHVSDCVNEEVNLPRVRVVCGRYAGLCSHVRICVCALLAVTINGVRSQLRCCCGRGGGENGAAKSQTSSQNSATSPPARSPASESSPAAKSCALGFPRSCSSLALSVVCSAMDRAGYKRLCSGGPLLLLLLLMISEGWLVVGGKGGFLEEVLPLEPVVSVPEGLLAGKEGTVEAVNITGAQVLTVGVGWRGVSGGVCVFCIG